MQTDLTPLSALAGDRADLRDAVRLSDTLQPEYLEYYGVLPLRITPQAVHVATWHTAPDPQTLDDLEILFGRQIRLAQYTESEIRAHIGRIYGGDVFGDMAAASAGDSDSDPSLEDLRVLANEAPVVRFVSGLLLDALDARASDIHLECEEHVLRVRYRIDGVLRDEQSPPAQMKAAVVSRLKIMAELDISERRLPQDGRIRLRLRANDVDVRISTVPTLHDESVVLRLLDTSRSVATLDEIGMAADTLRDFRTALERPNGMVLVTGPTGSGKTTTLYAALRHMSSGREKILTIEDPVEYELPHVCQMHVASKIGLTFAASLRAILRQDPDVVLVGEIRDTETAEVATHAALTGHLLLSTLHTTDAIGAIVRLADLGIPPYLVAATLHAIVAQRLVRKLCSECDGIGKQCDLCRGAGFHGRTAIYEAIKLDDEWKEEIASGASRSRLLTLFRKREIRDLKKDGLRLVELGVTTVEEINRVTAA